MKILQLNNKIIQADEIYIREIGVKSHLWLWVEYYVRFTTVTRRTKNKQLDCIINTTHYITKEKYLELQTELLVKVKK